MAIENYKCQCHPSCKRANIWREAVLSGVIRENGAPLYSSEKARYSTSIMKRPKATSAVNAQNKPA